MRGAIFVAGDAPDGVLVAVSERGTAPAGAPSPTALLARRLAESLGRPLLPIVRATQVHGASVAIVEARPSDGEVVNAGEHDALLTRLPGVGLVVQTADCVPVLLAAPGAVGAVHAGWRGAAAEVAAAAADAFLSLGVDRGAARAWLGPSIGPCCYEVGSEVAQRFPETFSRPARDGKHRLDLAAAVRAQLETAGIPPDRITAHPTCTMCGGEAFASWRRDREKAGRMIALVARLPRES